MTVDSKYIPPNINNPSLKNEDCEGVNCPDGNPLAEQPCPDEVCGEFAFTAPATVYSYNALNTYQVFRVIDDVEHVAGIFGSKTPFTRSFDICGDYVIKYCYCPDDGEEEPVFMLNDCAGNGNGSGTSTEPNTCDTALFVKDAVKTWETPLCDKFINRSSIDTFSQHEMTNAVSKIDAVTGEVVSTYTPTNGENWSAGSAYDSSNDDYYLFDENTGDWHRFDGSDIAAGSTNLGQFTGDTISDPYMNYGAIDKTTGLGHFGYRDDSRWIVDFTAQTITELPELDTGSNILASDEIISSIIITDDGDMYAYTYTDGHPATQETKSYLVNKDTGFLTLVGEAPFNVGITGAGADTSGDDLGFYGSELATGKLYQWENPDMSDMTEVGDFPQASTLEIGAIEYTRESVPFVRSFSQDCNGNITFNDQDYNGEPYTLVSSKPSPCVLDTVENNTTLTEIGCLSDPATADLSNVERCAIQQIIINGDILDTPLDAGWTPSELVDAVNLAKPNTLAMEGAGIVSSPGVAVGSIQIVCKHTDFLETFGTGGTDNNRLENPSTAMTFDPSGGIPDGSYAVTSFLDTGLANWHTVSGTMTKEDSQGDPEGNALFINASFEPAEFFRQPVNTEEGEEYQVSFWAANTGRLNTVINPNIVIDIVPTDDPSNILANYATGEITTHGEWINYRFNFSSRTALSDFVIRNTAPGGNGNDLAIDHIEFARISRQYVSFEQRGEQQPVEIVKIISPEGDIETLRVYSADGTEEYELPDPEGRILSTGNCLKANLEAGEVTVDPNPLIVTETAELGCADGIPWTRKTTVTHNTDNGTTERTLVTMTNSEGVTIGAGFPANFELGECPELKTNCRKSKERGETFTSDFVNIDPAPTLGSSDPILNIPITGPIAGVFADIELRDGADWNSATSAGITVIGAKMGPPHSIAVSFDFPDECEGVINVISTRLNFWDLDGVFGPSTTQEVLKFNKPFARVSDNLEIIPQAQPEDANTVVGGSGDAEHNWVEWDGLIDEIVLERLDGTGGNILLEGLEIVADVTAIYEGQEQIDGSYRYFDYNGDELTDSVKLARLRPCSEAICNENDDSTSSGGGTSSSNVTTNQSRDVGYLRVTSAGVIGHGLMEWSISNVGGADGTLNGEIFPAGATVTYRGYFDEDSREMRKLEGLSYDATGTVFLISTVH